MAHLKFPVPTSFNHSLALFKVGTDNLQLEQLDIGDGLVEIHHTERPYVEIPVTNLTKQNIVLVSRTALGSIQAIDRIIPTDQENSVQVSGIDTQPHKKTELWHPPVDISHLREDEQAVVKEILYEESNAFACDDHDIGCIPGLQMTIALKDDIPVQRSYAAIPQPLSQEVKAYIQDLLARRWIVKPKSPYSAPVVYVRRRDGTLRFCVDSIRRPSQIGTHSRGFKT